MPKPISLNILKKVASTITPTNPDYNLFVLGTDTNFSTGSTTEKQNGDTLAYAAQLVAAASNERHLLNDGHLVGHEPNKTISYQTSSVAVIDGPTTLGYEVGDRIAHGLFLVLQALAEGKTNIHISAHSRGSVESILIAHELKRIEEAFSTDPDQTIFQILQNSPCPYTQAAVKKLFKEVKESRDVREKLGKRIADAKITMFLMDPVPGGTLFAIPGLEWNDERIYKALPYKAEVVVARDERTCAFEASIPGGDQVKVTVMPGHHGTASGKLRDQALRSTPFAEGATASVQQLTLMKLLGSIASSTEVFTGKTSAISIENYGVLNDVAAAFMVQTNGERAASRHRMYNDILKNDAAYKHFTTTTYAPALIDYVNKFISFSCADINGMRIIHDGFGRNTPLEDDSIPGFVNKEHALLYLLEHCEFQLQEDENNLEVLVANLDKLIANLLTSYVTNNEKTLALFNNESTRTATFSAISLMINSISQKYLYNHLDPEVKVATITGLRSIFTNLKHEAAVPVINALEEVLHTGLQNTIRTHAETLISQSDTINNLLKYHLNPENKYEEAFREFLGKVKELHENQTHSGIKRILHNFIFSLEGIPETYASRNEVRKSFMLYFTPFTKSKKKSGDLYKVIDAISLLASANTPSLESFLIDDKKTILPDLNQLLENIVSVISKKEDIKDLIGNESLNNEIETLKLHKSRVVQLIAKIHIKYGMNLPDNDFRAEIQAEINNLSGTNPQITVLRGLADALRSELTMTSEDAARVQQGLTAERDALQAQVEALTIKVGQTDAETQTRTDAPTHMSTQTDELPQENAPTGNAVSTQTDLDAPELNNNQSEQLTKQNELIKQLQTPDESACLNHLNQKLIPLTHEYRQYLLERAAKINIAIVLPCNELPAFSGNESDNANYAILARKYAITQQLLTLLTDTETTPLPSQRVNHFAEALRSNNEQLKQHRDPAWKHYFKSCLAGLAILCSGVVPGLIILFSYAKVTNSSPLFFAQSKGEDYVNRVTPQQPVKLGAN